MTKPYRLFIIGLIITTITTFLLYKFLPKYNLLDGQSLIYLPGQSSPQTTTNNQIYTNIDILFKLGTYNFIYWTVLVASYLAAIKINFSKNFVNAHFILSIIGFLLIICLNKSITLTDFYSVKSDIYVSADVSEADKITLDKKMIFNNSLTNSTSLLGIFALGIGMLTLLINFNKGLKGVQERS